jgi:Zn ribbon nucleic-acid-binding protein
LSVGNLGITSCKLLLTCTMIDKVYIVLEENYTGEGSMLGTYSSVEYAVEAARKTLDTVVLFKNNEVATYESIERTFHTHSTFPVKLTSEMGRSVNIFEQVVDINYFLKK